MHLDCRRPPGGAVVGPAPAGGEGLAGTLATRGGRAGDATAAAVYADRSERPSLPPPLGGPACALPSRSRGPAAAAFHAVGHPTSLSTPTPITHHPSNASDYLVLCTYAVRPGYAYPSALLWVDLLVNKVGPCQ